MKAIATITILLSILSIITPVFAGTTAEEVMKYRQIRLAEFQDRIAEQIVSGNYSAAYCDMTTAYVAF